MIQELLHGAGMNRADAALHGADEFQVDPQHLRQIAGAFADLANQLYQICVPQRGGCAAARYSAEERLFTSRSSR